MKCCAPSSSCDRRARHDRRRLSEVLRRPRRAGREREASETGRERRAIGSPGAADLRCRPALRVGRPRLHPPAARRARRRSAMGRAVARHPPERPGHAGRRPAAGRRHRPAPLPAQGARRGRAAVAADPPVARTGAGRLRRRALPRSRAEARAAVRPDPVRGAVRHPAGRRDARAARRARRRRPGDGAATATAPAPRSTALYRGRVAIEPIVAAASASDRPEAAWVDAAGRALPRRSERGGDAAAQPRAPRIRARRSSSVRATSTPTSAVPASS